MTKYRAYIEFIYDESELPDLLLADKSFSAQNVAYETLMDMVGGDTLEILDLFQVEEIN